jgi:hypothetical protein
MENQQAVALADAVVAEVVREGGGLLNAADFVAAVENGFPLPEIPQMGQVVGELPPALAGLIVHPVIGGARAPEFVAPPPPPVPINNDWRANFQFPSNPFAANAVGSSPRQLVGGVPRELLPLPAADGRTSSPSLPASSDLPSNTNVVQSQPSPAVSSQTRFSEMSAVKFCCQRL